MWTQKWVSGWRRYGYPLNNCLFGAEDIWPRKIFAPTYQFHERQAGKPWLPVKLIVNQWMSVCTNIFGSHTRTYQVGVWYVNMVVTWLIYGKLTGLAWKIQTTNSHALWGSGRRWKTGLVCQNLDAFYWYVGIFSLCVISKLLLFWMVLSWYGHPSRKVQMICFWFSCQPIVS